MAILADIRRVDMRRVFTGSAHAIVATGAIVDETGVIEIGRNPGRRCVAVVTIVAALYMGWVLATRNCAVVTRTASADDLGVVDIVGRSPQRVVVAVLADI